METIDGLTDAQSVVDVVSGHLNAQHGRLVDVAAWLLANPDAWRGDGLWTADAYLRWKSGLSHATASKIVAVAERVDEFPACVDALRRGELSLDQIAPIVRHAPSWADRQMSGLAPRLMVAQISKVARQYPWGTGSDDTADRGDDAGECSGGSAPDDPADSDAAGNEAGSPPSDVGVADVAWAGWGDDGRFRVRLDVGADSGLLLESAIEEIRDHVFHERTDTPAVSTLDAFLDMAARSVGTVASPARRNRFRVNVHHDASTGAVTDSRGRHVPAETARRITCDALVSPVSVVDGVPVSVGRSQHIVPDRTRRLVEHRDGGCRVPGCRTDGFVEVHHIEHWAEGGATSTPNLICLCPKHHRLHHQGLLGIVGNADVPIENPESVTFSDRHGVRIRPSGAQPVPPRRPPPTIDGTWKPPLNERLETRWLFFNDDPNRPPPVTTASASLVDLR